jgi:hypothetical protein
VDAPHRCHREERSDVAIPRLVRFRPEDRHVALLLAMTFSFTGVGGTRPFSIKNA